LRFFAPQGRHVAPMAVKFGTEEGTFVNRPTSRLLISRSMIVKKLFYRKSSLEKVVQQNANTLRVRYQDRLQRRSNGKKTKEKNKLKESGRNM